MASHPPAAALTLVKGVRPGPGCDKVFYFIVYAAVAAVDVVYAKGEMTPLKISIAFWISMVGASEI